MSGFYAKTLIRVGDYESPEQWKDLAKAEKALLFDKNEKQAVSQVIAEYLPDVICDYESRNTVDGAYPEKRTEESYAEDPDECIIGFYEPKKLKEFAENMQKTALAGAKNRIMALVQSKEKEKGAATDTAQITAEHMLDMLIDDADSSFSYLMRLAFEEMDNHANCECECLTYTEAGYWRCFPDKYTLEKVRENPEEYAVVTLFFKD